MRRQFDVCQATGGAPNRDKRLVVVLQHGLLADLATIVVAPLYAVTELPAISHLRPVVRMGRIEYVIAIDRLASVPVRQLGRTVANLEDSRFQLIKALDVLFTGF